MRIDRGWVATILLSLGAAAVVMAAPAAWPQPFADGPIDPEQVLPPLRAAAAAVDAACARGSAGDFAAVTTAAHRRDLDRSLQVFDRAADGALLRELGRRQLAGRWLDGAPLAAHVRSGRLVLAMRREGGDGAQLVAFVWDGRTWLFDGTRQLPLVEVADAAAAVAAAARGDRR